MNFDPKRMPVKSPTLVSRRKIRQAMCGFDRKLFEDLHRLRPPLRNVQELVRLETQPPARML